MLAVVNFNQRYLRWPTTELVVVAVVVAHCALIREFALVQLPEHAVLATAVVVFAQLSADLELELSERRTTSQ